MNASDWPAVERLVGSLTRLSSYAYPRPLSAALKIIDDNAGFDAPDNLAKWANYTKQQDVVNVLLTRRSCLAHYVSWAFHTAHDSTGESSPNVTIEPQRMLDWCTERNQLYKRMLSTQNILAVLEYEALRHDPMEQIAPILRELGVDETSISSRLHDNRFLYANQKEHPGDSYSYLTNSDAVRAARPEQLDFAAPRWRAHGNRGWRRRLGRFRAS